MLVEQKKVRQFEEDQFRRWFSDDYFDLIVWHDAQGGITGFQLCYDKSRSERAFTWTRDEGYSHHRIDDGEQITRLKGSPILVSDGTFSAKAVSERFREASRGIDRYIADFVYEKILEYRTSGDHFM